MELTCQPPVNKDGSDLTQISFDNCFNFALVLGKSYVKYSVCGLCVLRCTIAKKFTCLLLLRIVSNSKKLLCLIIYMKG